MFAVHMHVPNMLLARKKPLRLNVLRVKSLLHMLECQGNVPPAAT